MKFTSSRFILAALAAFVAALAARAQTAPSEGLVVEIGAMVYRVPRLSIEGGTLTLADLAKLADPGDKTPLDARLARVSAKRIVVPEIRGESKAGARETRLLYRDVVLEDVANGRVGALRAASLEQSVKPTGDKGAGGAVEARYVNLSAKGVDARQLAHVLSAARENDKEEARTIEEEATIESVFFTFPDAGVEIHAGPVAALGLRARALAEPPLAAPSSNTPAAATPEQGAVLALAALGAMELGAFGARDVVVSGRGEPGEKPYGVKFGRLTLDKIAGARAREASIEDFALDSADGGHVALRRLILRGLDFNALLATGEGQSWRFDRIEAAGVAADLPDSGAEGRAKFEIGALKADLANYRDGVPTKFTVSLDRLKADLAARGDSPAARFFTSLGYRDLELSGDIAGAWREEARAFEIERARLDAKDMGAVTLQATFGNVGAAVFSPSPIVARAAMLTATIMRLETTVEGGGLIERMLAEEAKSTGGDIAKVRAEYARDARDAIAASLEGGEKATRIGDAVAKFINKPTRLRIKLSSPKGVGALELGLKKPGEILNELEVEAEAR
jgi:hypothetical protein